MYNKIVMNKKAVFILMLVVLSILSFSGIVFADALDTVHSSLSNMGDNIRAFAGVFCVISAIYLGLMFVLSAFNPKLKENAKGGLWGLIFGVIILLFADQIVFIVSELTGNSGNMLNRR